MKMKYLVQSLTVMRSNAGDEVAMFDSCLCNVNKPLDNKTAFSVDVDRVAGVATKTHWDLHGDRQLHAAMITTKQISIQVILLTNAETHIHSTLQLKTMFMYQGLKKPRFFLKKKAQPGGFFGRGFQLC